MFVKIGKTQNLSETMQYNEEKLQLGQATCLEAGNFVKDLSYLTKEDKLYHFERHTSLNKGVKHTGLHISLNFHPTDRLSDAQLVKLSQEYLEKMHLGEQPYLVYRHLDVAHPHVHLLTTNIRENGDRIHFSKEQYRGSNTIAKEMEQTYQLARSGLRDHQEKKQGQALTVQYGRTATMPAISQVLDRVVGQYKCTTLEALNAVLRLYNVEAYRGKEGSRLYQYRGLIYRVLNERGQPTGSQIKASSFDSKPTLARLEKQFELARREPRQQEQMQHIKTAVEWALLRRTLDQPGLVKALQNQRISLVLPRGEGGLEQVHYVDHQHRTVFKGKELGEHYYGKGLGERFAPTLTPEQQQLQVQKQQQQERARNEQSLER